MVIKNADDRSEDIAELKGLLTEKKITSQQRKRIEKEISDLERGAWGEQQAAYFLDFHFGGYKNSIVLHDLRLVLSNGKTAQIDHLIINRFLDVYVLESKNWKQLTVDETGACTTWSGRVVGTESPLEQCKRHADVLKRTFQIDPELKALARRQNFICRVLVAPSCHLKAPHHHEWYLKADAFHSSWEKEIDNEPIIQSVVSLTRMVSRETLHKIGQTLADLHNQSKRNWRAKFGLSPAAADVNTSAYNLVSSIKNLTDHVPSWGDNWFVLTVKPADETKIALNAAGYYANKENEKWVWRLRD